MLTQVCNSAFHIDYPSSTPRYQNQQIWLVVQPTRRPLPKSYPQQHLKRATSSLGDAHQKPRRRSYARYPLRKHPRMRHAVSLGMHRREKFQRASPTQTNRQTPHGYPYGERGTGRLPRGHAEVRLPERGRGAGAGVGVSTLRRRVETRGGGGADGREGVAASACRGSGEGTGKEGRWERSRDKERRKATRAGAACSVE